MKINLSKKQYRLLMERCFISDWVIKAYRDKPTEGMQGQDELLQYLLSFAKDFDFEDNTRDIKEADAVYWADEYLEKNPEVDEYIQHYNLNWFADMLSNRLAALALEEKYSKEELEAMDPKELAEQFRKLKHQALANSSLLQTPGAGEEGQ